MCSYVCMSCWFIMLGVSRRAWLNCVERLYCDAWLFHMILRCLREFFRLQVILHLVFGMVLPWDSQFVNVETWNDLVRLVHWILLELIHNLRGQGTSGVGGGHPKPYFMVPTWWDPEEKTWMQAMATTVEESTSRSQGSQASRSWTFPVYRHSASFFFMLLIGTKKHEKK